MKYYEIILNDFVITVCAEDHCEHAFRGNSKYAFGRITKQKFQSYGDKPWEIPFSMVRYSPRYIFTMGLSHCE
jgi:hypothetical protein